LFERDRLLAELARQPGWNAEQDPLQTYLALIRRDGAAAHVPMRRSLSQLATNQVSLLALAEAFEPQARGKGYASALQALRGYVLGWNQRWNELFEVFMAGGNLASEQSPFPKVFADALRAEGAGGD
jgi:hypothetical protein